MLSATRQRTKELAAHSGTQPNFVTIALKQRQLASAYSGGALAGYQGSCSFIPDQIDINHWTYNCFGRRTYQNGNRVCSENNDFASYTTEVTRNVSIVQNGKSKPIANCAIGTETDSHCPDGKLDSDNAARWNITTQGKNLIPIDAEKLSKIDPDLPYDDDDNRGWMHACLTDPSFPLANPSADYDK